MNKEKILSGDQLVTKGATKLEATLPEIGLKDVIPNGSWLEQKQIQAALEARKHLVEVERIEKSGVLSHAEWREDLQLAEVTQKVGSYWQYVGHNVGKNLYLNPEETLFLIEVNCLQLKYNDITVSLQQAYSLLLRGKISLIQYKVYASLSRFGYKVFRHKDIQPTDYEKKLKIVSDMENRKSNKNVKDIVSELENINKSKSVHSNEKNRPDTEENITDKTTYMKEPDTMDVIEHNNAIERSVWTEILNEHVEYRKNTDMESQEANIAESTSVTNNTNGNISQTVKIQMSSEFGNYNLHTIKKRILEKLHSRRNTVNRNSHRGFENVPDFTENRIVSVKAPEEQHIPRNVFLNNTAYVINIDNIKIRSVASSTDSRTYSISDEVNGEHVRRVRDSSTIEYNQNNWNPSFDSNTRFRQFNGWRPRSNFNFFPFHFFFQRPFLSNVYFGSRFQFFPRPVPPLFRQFPNVDNFNVPSHDRNITPDNRKRTRNNLKRQHLENIKRLALRVKQSYLSRNLQPLEEQALQRLLLTYNTRYKSRLRFTEHFDVVEDENIVDTIELDDDDESKSKKSRSNECNDSFTNNLIQLKQLALKLKLLQENLTASSKHRRAFSNVIKTFNNSFKADIYLNKDYKIIDRKHIDLDSSSNSDCIIEETQEKTKRTKSVTGKMVKNPFSIMKNLSQIDSAGADPSTSKDSKTCSETNLDEAKNCYDELFKIFGSEWLPKNDDFGRAELPSKYCMINQLIDSKREDYYLYDCMRSQSLEFENWVDVKVAFWETMEETPVDIQCDLDSSNDTAINSLLKLEDCTDMPTILKKLRIIRTNKETDQTTLTIDFDVYNRDIQNFRKSNRPKPHFRVICVDESTRFPSGVDIATLHSKYEDGVSIIFAIVGISSISFIQMNPVDLPLYIPNSDLP